MHATQVLDAQVDLVERLKYDDMFYSYTKEAWLGQPERQRKLADRTLNDEERDTLMGAMVYRLENCPAFHVTADMCAMIRHAASQFSDDEILDIEVAPTQTGFARFDEPIPVIDRHGQLLKVHWIAWGGVTRTGTIKGAKFVDEVFTQEPIDGKKAMLVWAWNDTRNDPDHREESSIAAAKAELIERGESPDVIEHNLERLIGTWGWIGSAILNDGVAVGPIMLTEVPEYAVDSQKNDMEVHGNPYTNFNRYMYAFWLMLNQTITLVDDGKIDRSTRRRATRMGIPDRVTVVQLRRSEHRPAEGETLVEWSHRWAVRGHWRMQPYGPGRKEVKRIWIPPHIKGPADKPLVITDKVYDLRR